MIVQCPWAEQVALAADDLLLSTDVGEHLESLSPAVNCWPI